MEIFILSVIYPPWNKRGIFQRKREIRTSLFEGLIIPMLVIKQTSLYYL